MSDLGLILLTCLTKLGLGIGAEAEVVNTYPYFVGVAIYLSHGFGSIGWQYLRLDVEISSQFFLKFIEKYYQ